MNKLSLEEINHVAKLANLPVDPEKIDQLSKQFLVTINFVDQLNEVNTDNVESTAQVTGLTNIWRDDVVESKRILSQEDCLRNATKTYNGYFIVPKVF